MELRWGGIYAADIGVDEDVVWLESRLWEKFVATEGRRKVCVAPFMRDRVLCTHKPLVTGPHHLSERKPAIQSSQDVNSDRRDLAYHSPEPPPSLLEDSWVLPAAAEAKLEGRGEGILVRLFIGNICQFQNTINQKVGCSYQPKHAVRRGERSSAK